MKRILPAIIIFVAIIILALGAFNPLVGGVHEVWQTSNEVFQIRVVSRYERMLMPGMYFIFEAAPAGSKDWSEVMTFRHDDPGWIRRDQVHFVNSRVGYAFMGWMYAVTTDDGASWSIWDAVKDLPGWECCNYSLIKDVTLAPDGTGMMILNPIPGRNGEVPELHTSDYGRSWHP